MMNRRSFLSQAMAAAATTATLPGSATAQTIDYDSLANRIANSLKSFYRSGMGQQLRDMEHFMAFESDRATARTRTQARNHMALIHSINNGSFFENSPTEKMRALQCGVNYTANNLYARHIISNDRDTKRLIYAQYQNMLTLNNELYSIMGGSNTSCGTHIRRVLD